MNIMKNSKWICGKNGSEPDTYTEYSLPITVSDGKEYVFTVACDSDYALYDGKTLLAFGQYADYPDYRIFDRVTLPSLPVGEQKLSLLVWYQGVGSQTYVAKPSGVRFSIEESGKEILVSDTSILSREAAGYIPGLKRMITGQLGLSFGYDAERSAGDWSESLLSEGADELYPRPVKKLTLSERVPAAVVQSGGFVLQGGRTLGDVMQSALMSVYTKSVTLDGNGSVSFTCRNGEGGTYIIVDMGRETAGLIDFEFSVNAPCRVIGGWGEHLVDGRCRTGVRDFSFEYYAKAGSNKLLHPLRRFGGRYVQLFFETDKVNVSYVGIRETAYPIDVTYKMRGDLLRDRIAEVCINTLRQCMHEHYEDCPWREQALYTLDSRNQMLCGYSAFSETEFPRACLELISHGRRNDGLLSLCYPAGTDHPIPAFSLVYFIQMREYLDYSKDVEFIRGKYSFLKSLIETFISHRDENGLVPNFRGVGHWNFYEWSDGMDGGLGKPQPEAYEAPLNAFLSLALQNLAAIAEELDEKADAKYYSETAKSVNEALREHYFNSEAGLFRSFSDRRFDQYSVLTNSLCLLCGAADGVDNSVILSVLETNGSDTDMNVVPNTLSMNGFRFDALLKADREHYAPIILNEIDTTYLSMLEQGATSFWETILGEKDFDNAGSLCHGWSALPIHYYNMLT